jgi:NAD(P)-dependent dehydrogenase (short-subunit alcohol dehydrogenase family)
METELEGRVAVVTGGGRGIGRAVALALAQAGARVAALARTQSEIDETVALMKRSGDAQAFAVDVTDTSGVRRAMDKVEATLGPVDVLVNNAGQLGRIGPFVESDPSEWWRVLDVNLRGPMLCTRAVLPGMMARGRGRIVNIASGVLPYPYLSAYVTSKTALVRFSETLAAETRARGVHVFAIGPGTTRTAMSEHSLTSTEGRQWIPWFGRIFTEKLDVPMERPVRLVVDLASGQADTLSGRYLTVFDDLAVLRSRTAEIEREGFYSLCVRKFDCDGTGTPAALAALLTTGERGGG